MGEMLLLPFRVEKFVEKFVEVKAKDGGTRSRTPRCTCAAGELKTQLQRRGARALTLRTWNDFG